MKIFVKKLKTMRINHKILNYIKKVDNKTIPFKKEINFNKEKKCINELKGADLNGIKKMLNIKD